jgi:hypothetical protein
MQHKDVYDVITRPLNTNNFKLLLCTAGVCLSICLSVYLYLARMLTTSKGGLQDGRMGSIGMFEEVAHS